MRNFIAIVVTVCALDSLLFGDMPRENETPAAAFNAYRTASIKGEWLTVWNKMTKSLQENELYECYYITQVRPDDPKIINLLNKHKIDPTVIEREYESLREKIKKKDITQIEHAELLIKAVNKHVNDKAGFFVDMCNAFDNPTAILGATNDISVNGNSARVSTTKTIHSLRGFPGQPSKTVAQKIPVTFDLIFVNNSWLIDKK